MRFYVLIFLIVAPLFSWSQQNRWTKGKAFLDLEDGDKISVFSTPGFDWSTCAKDASCKTIGWPDNAAEIEIVSDSAKQFMMTDSVSQQKVATDFVKVKYKYQRTVKGKVITQQGEGWIDAAPLRQKKLNTFFGTDSKPKPKCPPDQKSQSPADEIKKSLEGYESAFANVSVVAAAQAIEEKIGACVITPKQDSFAPGNPYDNYAYPAVSKSVPNISKEDGTKLTHQDMVSIDAWARTLMSELGVSCFKKGLHYPMAVLKVGVNRYEDAQKKSQYRKMYITGPHLSAKSDLAKLATSGSQFNVWNHKHEGRSNPTLPQALCPPSNTSKPFYLGRKPHEYEVRVWENAVLIATEAVLFPKKFAARTAEVKQSNYTSNMPSFYNMTKAFPSIEGRKIDDQRCVQLWNK